MKVKPDLSFWKLWNISFGFFGVQIAYALQSANISRIFSTLGADPHSLSYFWILPPLAGIIVQPIVGAASDRTWTRFGRRIPYLFIGWVFLKLGTAYRLAAGADFAHKLMGLGQTIGPAFADFAPGLNPFDWLIGIVGAVGFRLLIYVKSRNAKKFRRDEEYGSARWGSEKDIRPFVDPKFENNIILTGTEFLTMNTRPKNPANARNLNACVIGSSGSGKTRFWLTPQILQASADKNGGCSYVCVDPKGGVLGQVGHFLQKRGYRIKVFNSIDFTKSMHYNPLAYARHEVA